MRLKRALDRLAGSAGSSHRSVPIGLERNREASVELGAQNPPDMPLYRFRLGLRAGLGGEQRPCISVRRRVNPNPHPVLKEIFYCEVAGTVLEAANVHALRAKVARVLETLAPGKSLPLAYFRAPAMDYSLPVYCEENGELVCPVLAGPRLKADELATMRRHVGRYLVSAGYVADESQVELRVLRPSDLGLVPPAAILRSLDHPDLWLATVEGRSAEGLVIGLLGESTELRAEERERAGAQPHDSPPAAADATSLLRLVGNGLADAGRLRDPFDLYATQVRPEIWTRTEQLTDEAGRRLTCWLNDDPPSRLELPLRHTAAGELTAALEDRGICVFVAPDEPQLAKRVGRYLSEHGFLRWEDSIDVVAGQEPPEPPDSQDLLPARGEIDFPRLEFGAAPEGPSAPAQQFQENEMEVGSQ